MRGTDEGEPMRPDGGRSGGAGSDGQAPGGAGPGEIGPRDLRPRSRRPSPGIGSILLIDLLALMVVLASAPAAWLWLDSSHPSPVAAGGAGPGGQSSSPAPGISLAPSGSPGASAVASGLNAASGGPSPQLTYGDGTWATVESLPRAEWGAGSAVLRDGRVLVAGGALAASSNSATDSVTIYDPATGHWSVATHMLGPRAYPMVVTLNDGSVLAAGGSRNLQPLDTAERYYPENGTWVAAGRLNVPRTQATLTVLGDGRVLAAGGGMEGSPGWASTASTEIFDPKTGVWSPAAPMSEARAFHTATLLGTGEVLVAGGATTYNGTRGTVTRDAEIYSPRSNSWRPAPRMTAARYAGSAAFLPGGRVLVAGGWSLTTNDDPSLASAEIYDPGANTWTATASLSVGRGSLAMAGLPDGRVLAVAGVDPTYHVLASTEIYDPGLGKWQIAGQLPVAMERAAMGVLLDGRVLVAGGAIDATAGRVTAVCSVYSAKPPR